MNHESSLNIEKFHFSRPALAQMLANELQGPLGFGTLAPLPLSGTFLSAPRRVGKSTFLRDELKPILEAEGHAVVYIDLWEQRHIEPAMLLRRSLYAEIAKKTSRLKRAAKAIGLTKVSALSIITIDLSQATPADDVSLTELLVALADKSKTKKVVFIVDEAQEAMSTERGESAMFGLKAARDALNSPRNPRLMLLCTGSSRSKLSTLVTGKQSPFYGARVMDFPVLGAEFCLAFTKFMNQRVKGAMKFEATAMQQAFELLGSRPEDLFGAAGMTLTKVLVGSNSASKTLSEALIRVATDMNSRVNSELQRQFDSMPASQQAVLLHLIRERGSFAPFAKEALAAYAKHVGVKAKISTASIQTALEALVQRDIVWQSKRGVYELDDLQWVEWWAERESK